MYARVEKSKENESRAIANTVALKKNNVKEGFGFVDNRKESVVQKKLQELINNSQEIPFPTIQRQKYEKKITVPNNFIATNWPPILSAGGTDADSKIASDVNKTLVEMGWPNSLLMSAHMVPNRLGGKGNNSNVRPWARSFEKNLWEDKMEKPFNEVMGQMSAGSNLNYTVETEDLTDAEADKIVEKADYSIGTQEYNTAKIRLMKIPKNVKTSIGGLGVLNTDACWPTEIKDLKP